MREGNFGKRMHTDSAPFISPERQVRRRKGPVEQGTAARPGSWTVSRIRGTRTGRSGCAAARRARAALAVKQNDRVQCKRSALAAAFAGIGKQIRDPALVILGEGCDACTAIERMTARRHNKAGFGLGLGRACCGVGPEWNSGVPVPLLTEEPARRSPSRIMKGNYIPK